MPRYFLNQVHKGELIPDVEGAEFADLEAVRKEAVLAAREIMADRLIKGEEVNHSKFEVLSETGTVVLTLPFSEALPKDEAQ
jgi:hypothetical protein